MLRPRIQKLVEALDAEIKKVEKIVKKTKQSAQEIAKTSRTSMSAAGDREHSSNQAFIAQDFLAELKVTRAKTLKEKEVTARTEGTCYLEILFDDDRNENYYFIEKTIELDGFKFVSHDSPLGKELLGKALNEHFKLDYPHISGIIKLIG